MDTTNDEVESPHRAVGETEVEQAQHSREAHEPIRGAAAARGRGALAAPAAGERGHHCEGHREDWGERALEKCRDRRIRILLANVTQNRKVSPCGMKYPRRADGAISETVRHGSKNSTLFDRK